MNSARRMLLPTLVSTLLYSGTGISAPAVTINGVSCGTVAAMELNGGTSLALTLTNATCLAGGGGDAGGGDAGGGDAGGGDAGGGDAGGGDAGGGDAGGGDAGGGDAGGGDAGESCQEVAAGNDNIVCKGTDVKFEGGGTYQQNRITKGEIHVWKVEYTGRSQSGFFILTDGGLMDIGLSRVPGDLNPSDARCKTSSTQRGNGIRWAAESQAGYRDCPLVPGTTYYINIHTDRNSDNYNLGH